MIRRHTVVLIFLVVNFACSAGDSVRQGTQDFMEHDATQTDTAFESILDQGPADAADIGAGEVNGKPYVALVNPFMGTGGDLANIGSALPGATAPFGMVKASPDTTTRYGSPPGFQHCAGYWYPDTHMYGISHNHLHGTGAPDYGNILIFPTVGMSEQKTSRRDFFQPFTHEAEVASPGYYAVTITEPRVRVELTATTRCAHHRYKFEGKDSLGTIVINASSSLLDGRSKGGQVVVDGRKVYGFSHNFGAFSGRYGGFPVFFAAEFSRDFVGFGTWTGRTLHKGVSQVEVTEDDASFGAWFDFDVSKQQTVELKVCLSYVGVDGAWKNMEAEMPDWDFEGVRARTETEWERELGRFEVVGGTKEQRIIFYTAVYHVLQMPTVWTDVDGRYRGFDGQVHEASGWTYYTDMSLWDTFRTEHPLLTIMWPDRQTDMVRSLVVMQKQGGYVPKWPMGMGDTGSMIGQHGATVVADTFLKGLRDFDIEAIYKSLKSTAMALGGPGSYGNRDCFPWYTDPAYGYCPADKTGDSVSKTLEYAFNDFCLAELARALGRSEDEAIFRQRAENFRNVWNDQTGFFAPRREDGSFVDFPPDLWDPGQYYTEGTGWQWLWFVPHDVAGLQALMGGPERFAERLSEFFARAKENFSFVLPTPWYFHGNEPDIHAAFLFTESGRPDLTQLWTRWILEENYKNSWNGLVGNDDAGTLSAWYVFVASGLYPWPCFTWYLVTVPLFDEVTWYLPNGKKLRVIAPKAIPATQALWNGDVLLDWRLDHEALMAGGTLEFH